MEVKGGKRISSLQQRMTSILLVVILPFSCLFLLYNYYILKVYEREFIQSGRQANQMYAQRINKDLEAVSTLLFNLLYSSVDFRTLSHRTTELKSHVAAYNITEQYRTMLGAYGGTGAFFVCSADNDVYRDSFADGYNYADIRAIREYIRSLAGDREDRFSSCWFVERVEGRPYLFRMLGGDGTYIAAMMDFERILQQKELPEGVHGFFAVGDTPLCGEEYLADHSIVLRPGQPDIYSAGEGDSHLVVRQGLEQTEVELVFLYTHPSLFTQMRGIQTILLVLSGTVLLCVVFAYLRIQRSVVAPFRDLVDHIAEDLEGPPGPDAHEYKIAEFHQVSSRVDALRLQAYEREIEKQKAELQYLQLQTRPHFYLNCLKSLYGMAQRGRYAQIQEMILAISAHLRYTFKDNQKLVPLSQELQHVRNYIHIQNLAMRQPPRYTCTVPDGVLSIPVPPFSIQTFVENSVKYAFQAGAELTVSVNAVLLEAEDGRYLDVSVYDNGSGFPDAVLKAPQSGEGADLYGEDHVGIRNVVNRLALLYEGQATLALFNTAQGAVAEIILPVARSAEPLSEEVQAL